VVVVATCVGSAGGVLVTVVPEVAGVLQELDGTLPQGTQVLQVTPGLLVWFELVLAGALAAVAGRLHAGTQVPQTTLGLYCWFVPEPEVAATDQLAPVSVQHSTHVGF